MFTKLVAVSGFFGMLAISSLAMAAGYGETYSGSECQTTSTSASFNNSTGTIGNKNTQSFLTVLCPLDRAYPVKLASVVVGVLNQNRAGTSCTLYSLNRDGTGTNYKKVTIKTISGKVQDLKIQNFTVGPAGPVHWYTFLQCVLPPKSANKMSSIYWYDFYQAW